MLSMYFQAENVRESETQGRQPDGKCVEQRDPSDALPDTLSQMALHEMGLA